MTIISLTIAQFLSVVLKDTIIPTIQSPTDGKMLKKTVVKRVREKAQKT